MLNPCFCIAPRIGTFVFAILDIVLIVPYIWVVIDTWVNKDFQYELVVEVVLCVCVVLLAIILLVGVVQNSQWKIQFWMLLWVVLLLVAIPFQIVIISTNNREEVRTRVGTSFGGLGLFLYQLWVVAAYLIELKIGEHELTYFPGRIGVK